MEDMFKSTNSNLVFCINEKKDSKIISLLSKEKLDCDKICNGAVYYYCLEDKCPEEYKFLIPQKRKCIKNCILDDVYNYEYNYQCYSKEDLINNLINIYSAESINTKVQYLIDTLIKLSIMHNTTSVLNDTQIEENILKIPEFIFSENIMSEIKDGQDLIIKMPESIISLTSTENQNINKNNNISTIDLGACENILKTEYNISNNESLLIYKMDVLKKGMKIPRIEYKVYYVINRKQLVQLDLNKCKNLKIEIHIPIMINEKNIDKYNISSNYYKDICYKITSENGTDITLNDRKNEFIDKDMNACEENCVFKKYDKDINKALCSCKIKTNFNLFSQVRKNSTLLLIGFKDIKNRINLKIMKCYYTLFKISGLSKNIGSYITFSIILFHFISIIIFYKIEFSKIKNKISVIAYCIKNLKKINNKNVKI